MSDSFSRDRAESDFAGDALESQARGPAEPNPQGPSVNTIRDLFRVEAHELLVGMGSRLGQLSARIGDGSGLAEIAARGHALKGSAALAELPYLSRAGAILQRAAELAADDARRNLVAAQDLVRATHAALGPAQRMLEDCVDGSVESQERLFAELLDAFSPETRATLSGAVSRDEADEAEIPEFEEAPLPLDDLAPGDETAAELIRRLEAEQAEADGDADDDAGHAAAEGFDPELVQLLAETFQQELRELLGAVPEMIAGLADPAQQANLCADLGRIFHTVKGSAATVGRDDLRDVGSTLQNEFESHADDALMPLPPAFLSRLAPPLEAVFLAAGLEPPLAALELSASAARAFLVEQGDGDETVAAAEVLPPPLFGESADDDEPQSAARIEPEMMEAFTLDADAALSASETALLYLERNPRDRTQLRALFRHFHTLKGAAAAVGLTRIAEQLHAGETLLETVIESPIERSPERLIELLLELVDSVAGLLAQVRGTPHEHQILDDVEGRVAEVLASVGDESRAEETPGTTPAAATAVAPREEAAVTPAPPTEIDSAIVRVHASRLDLLMNRVSELVVSRTRMKTR